MSFNDNVTLDTSQVRTGGGGGGPGGMVVGGGLGGIVMLILALIFGINPGDVGGGTSPDQGQGRCRRAVTRTPRRSPSAGPAPTRTAAPSAASSAR